MTTNTEWLYIVTDSNKSPNGFFIPPEMLGMEDGRNIAVLYNNSHYDQSHCQVSIDIVYYPIPIPISVLPIAAMSICFEIFMSKRDNLFILIMFLKIT